MSEKRVLSEMTVGERIKTIRELHGMSAITLSDKTVLLLGRINQIESDESEPYAYEVSRIADALGVTVKLLSGRVSV